MVRIVFVHYSTISRYVIIEFFCYSYFTIKYTMRSSISRTIQCIPCTNRMVGSEVIAESTYNKMIFRTTCLVVTIVLLPNFTNIGNLLKSRILYGLRILISATL